MITQYPERDLSGLNLAEGNTEYTTVHKFGRNSAIGTSFVPVSLSSDYKMPSSAVSLEVVSTNSNDNLTGSGARSVMVEGLGADWLPLTQSIDLNGTTPSAIPLAMTRVFKIFVHYSGTYADKDDGSHLGDIVAQELGGGDEWARISSADYARGQGEIAAYSVPLGKTAFMQSVIISVDSNKSASVLLLHRAGANVISAPFGASRIVLELAGVSGEEVIKPYCPYGPYVGPCDIYFLSKVSAGSAEVDIDFELTIKDT